MMEVAIPKSIRARLKYALRKAGRREIGGLLMGRQFSPGKFEVVDFSADSISGNHSCFVRDVSYHNEALNQFFERTGHDYQVFNYLGEWHSHPNHPVQPSLTDCHSMLDLVRNEPGIEFSILMIVKLGFFVHLNLSATLFRCDGTMEAAILSTPRKE